MKKYLILVKHSLPEIIEGIPAREWKLSDEGRVRSQRLAEELSPFHPEAIFSSIEPKAKETAAIIASRHNLKLHVPDGLHEHDRSDTPYLSKNRFQAAIREFFEKPDTLVLGGETADEAYARFYSALQAVLQNYANETVIIVSHGTVISLLVSRLVGISDLLLWSELGLPSYVVLDTQTNTFVTRKNFV
jgi:broad specificity phosphatase PhoE